MKRTTGARPGETRKILGVMAVTSSLTFATLTTGYQMLFTHSVFA